MGGWAIVVHASAGVDPNLPPHNQEEAKQLCKPLLCKGLPYFHFSSILLPWVTMMMIVNSSCVGLISTTCIDICLAIKLIGLSLI